MDQVLEPIPGVFLQNPFNFSQDLRIAIRGFGVRSSFGVRGIKIITDGFSETLADGSTPLDSIDPDLVESVEVLRGAGSSLYGNTGGGAVLFKTRSGPDAGTKFSSQIKVGKFGMHKRQLFFGEGGKFGSYRLYLSNLQYNGFREHSETESSISNFKAHYVPDSKTRWTFLIGLLNSPKAQDPGALTASESDNDPRQARSRNVLFESGEQVRQHNISIRIEKELNESWNIHGRIGIVQRFFENKLPFQNGGAVDLDRIALNTGVKNIFDWEYSGIPIMSVSGFDYLGQFDDRKRFENVQGVLGSLTLDQDEDVSTYGIYLRNKVDVSNNWGLGLGVRYDSNQFDVSDNLLSDEDQSGTQTLSSWSGSAGTTWKIRKDFNLFVNFSTAFETPAIIELANNHSGVGGLNPDLDPRYSFSYETGIKGNLETLLSYEFSVFLIRTRDEIVPFEVSQFPGRSFFKNSGNSERSGMEIAFSYRVKPTLNFQLAYTYSNFKLREFSENSVDLKGNEIPGIPQNQLFAEMKWKSPSGLFALWKGRYIDKLFADRENTTIAPDYFLNNFQLGIEKEFGAFQGSLFFGVDNATDVNYFANTRVGATNGFFFEPGPPISLRGGFQISFQKRKS